MFSLVHALASRSPAGLLAVVGKRCRPGMGGGPLIIGGMPGGGGPRIIGCIGGGIIEGGAFRLK